VERGPVHQDFADLVFHVLAHVSATAALPASLFDPGYVQFAEAALGSSQARQLGDDCRTLGRLLQTHERLAKVQRLAWLHASVEEFAASEQRPLSELRPAEVGRPDLLTALRLDELALTEILRCAVALERPHHAQLPRCEAVPVELAPWLTTLASVAPFLAAAEVDCVRALCWRGRVAGRSIWVGLPASVAGPSVEHAAFQAAHEATVAELLEAARRAGVSLPERGLERAALWLFATRCRRAGLEAKHHVWFRRMTLPADWTTAVGEKLGLAPLPPELSGLADRCLASPLAR